MKIEGGTTEVRKEGRRKERRKGGEGEGRKDRKKREE